MTRIHAIANQKGGVGKTTTAVNLGAYLAAAGRRTLLVDMDPQANATSSLGFDKNTISPSIYHVLLEEITFEKIILLTDRLHLDLAPSSPDLAGAEVELVSMERREFLLKQKLIPISDRYDSILIDCPPSLGLLTVNALAAADAVIIPIQCEYLPLEGLSMLMGTVDRVRERLNPDLTISGLLMTMHDSRTKISQQVIEEVRKHFPEWVFETVIPRNVRLSEAPSYGETILSYQPRSTGAQSYEELAQELLNMEATTDSDIQAGPIASRGDQV